MTIRQTITTPTNGISGLISRSSGSSHRAGGEQVHAEGRGDHAQRQVDDHDDAEVHRFHAEFQRHRQQQRASTTMDADVSMNMPMTNSAAFTPIRNVNLVSNTCASQTPSASGMPARLSGS